MVSSDAIVVWLENVRKDDIHIVGGKCANLGELTAKGVTVPPGFAVTADAFRRFLEETKIGEVIQKTLTSSNGPRDPKQYEEASQEIRKIIESAPMPSDIANEVRSAYRDLERKTNSPQVKVAVRSSATSEDLPDASFAGQQDTYLNVKGEDALVHYVQKCWSSLYTPRAIFYREEKGFPHEKVLISVGVQKMVESEVSGVIFTLDPVNGDPSKIIIESSWGLGEALVAGVVRPDRFIVDKGTLQIVHKEIVPKMVEHVPNHETGLTMEREVPAERRNAASLGDEQVVELARLARDIEDHYQTPQDVEFAVERSKSGQKVYVVQTRPETFWARMKSPSESGKSPVLDRVVVVQGLAASPGLHAGRAKIVVGLQDAGRMMKDKDILVTRMTNPDWVPYMKIAGAIVTEDGGTTCHAAIVSREMGIPCIVGARNATKVLQTGKEYTVDAKAGVVYQGLVEDVLKPAAAVGQQIPTVIPVTSTRIYVNISLPELAEKVARETHADGVGLLRAEHMMLSVGKHPRLLIEEGGGQKMVDAFAEGVRKVATPFAPKPVVYRCLDFKPDEFLGLPGGEKYEREAGHVGPNPLLGFRGAFRYVKEPDVFRLECRAIRKVREEFKLTNVHVMLPFVRTLEDFRNAKKIMEEEGLKRSPDFKLWIMCEVPATVLLIDKFVLEGIDGISFGTNDLTMLILGIDRDDASIQEIYDERNLAVLRAMSHVIRICSEAGVTTSICGQAPSNYPEVVEFLVREGAVSMSVNPDKVIETKQLVAGIEQKLILEGMRKMRQNNGDSGALQPRWPK
ncbi:MAG TPA: phosphoenolpyruvate synthase [Candidatus Dormibacteraeota bacterium]|nr:phosphoenolpyruvate synthase [Candidatus Dormibacteraeota bacterium]